MGENVAVLGATDDPLKYAHRALVMLQDRGHNPIPVNPSKSTIDGLRVYPSMREISDPVDTVTVYVRQSISSELLDDFLAVKPQRVILNPGTENPELEKSLKQNGIEVIRGCTLVMLQTGSF